MSAKRNPRPATLEEQRARQLEFYDSESSGPVLVPAITRHSPAPPKRPPSGGRVPYGVALRQITKTVVNVLNEYGEQWDDNSRQAMVCTLFIQAAREKKIDFGFDEEAA